MTRIRLAAADEDVLTGALQAAWKLRVDANAKSKKSARASSRKRAVAARSR
jgi:hypothetical protein